MCFLLIKRSNKRLPPPPPLPLGDCFYLWIRAAGFRTPRPPYTRSAKLISYSWEFRMGLQLKCDRWKQTELFCVLTEAFFRIAASEAHGVPMKILLLCFCFLKYYATAPGYSFLMRCAHIADSNLTTRAILLGISIGTSKQKAENSNTHTSKKQMKRSLFTTH